MYQLTHWISPYFIYASRILLFQFFGFFVYVAFFSRQDILALIILVPALIILIYVQIKSRRFKSVCFDERFIYSGADKISYQEVKFIEKGKITYERMATTKNIHYNPIFEVNYNVLSVYLSNSKSGKM